MKKNFCRMVIRNSSQIFGGPESGTKYDLTGACPECGTGARQVGPLLLSTDRFPRKQIFSTLDREILVKAELANVLIKAGLETILVEVLHARTKKPLPVLQLRQEGELPPFSPQSSGIVRERPCRTCNRDGYFGIPHEPAMLHFNAVDPDLLKHDVLVTYERFGNSRLREPFHESVFAAPWYIVSDQFSSVLDEQKVKGVEYESVQIDY